MGFVKMAGGAILILMSIQVVIARSCGGTADVEVFQETWDVDMVGQSFQLVGTPGKPQDSSY